MAQGTPSPVSPLAQGTPSPVSPLAYGKSVLKIEVHTDVP